MNNFDDLFEQQPSWRSHGAPSFSLYIALIIARYYSCVNSVLCSFGCFAKRPGKKRSGIFRTVVLI